MSEMDMIMDMIRCYTVSDPPMRESDCVYKFVQLDFCGS